jgi:hypothetical protein
MLAYALDRRPEKPVDFEERLDEGELIYQWRKHPDLHGWMENLYRLKDGKDKMFNTSTLVLDSDDLDRLEKVVRANELPHTTGYFFGASQYPEDTNSTLEFIAKARAAIASGKTVFYTSWW